ncbi:MAG: transposase family protein, partial [Hormoscilla sp. SP12CHS1]|nr:transposase family protein [Hormoscilla sp. SP12CHS1]
MNETDRLWDETDSIFTSWNLQEIPFSESASSLRSNLDKVFTGRTQELKRIFNLLRGRERKRILVYGSISIGKTAFILAVLSVLQRKTKDTLATYISLPKLLVEDQILLTLIYLRQGLTFQMLGVHFH